MPLPIVSVTLCGDPTPDRVLAAINSVPWVTHHQVLCTNGAAWPQLSTLPPRVDTRRVDLRQVQWTGSFGEMRNKCLEWARRVFGPCFVLYLDSDMTYSGAPPEPLDPAIAAYRLEYGDGTYNRELLVRSASVEDERWTGRTHESLVANGPVRALEGLTWTEPKKDPETLRAKLLRDRLALADQIEEEPNDPRWRFYYAETYKGLESHEIAQRLYRKVLDMEGWSEQRAWSAFQAADSLMRLNRPKEAAEVAMQGIFHYPQMPELYFVAAHANAQGGLPGNAHFLAVVALLAAQTHENLARIGFRYRHAWNGGPRELIASLTQPAAECPSPP